MHPEVNFFDVRDYYASIKSGHATAAVTVATDEGIQTATAEGNGPMNALDLALLQECWRFPRAIRRLADVRLTDYKVRVLDSKSTAARSARAGRVVGSRQRAGRQSGFQTT